MGQPIVVKEKPSSNPGVVRFETNRAFTGMGHEHYRHQNEVWGDRPPDELARRLFAHGGIDTVHINGNIVTIDLAKGYTSEGLQTIIESLYLFYPPAAEGEPAPSGAEAGPVAAASASSDVAEATAASVPEDAEGNPAPESAVDPDAETDPEGPPAVAETDDGEAVAEPVAEVEPAAEPVAAEPVAPEADSEPAAEPADGTDAPAE